MLHQPNNGQKVFEVRIYNKDVRAMVKENRSHCFFDDQWADPQIRDICANDEVEARELIRERFPVADGFVIEKVNQGRF